MLLQFLLVIFCIGWISVDCNDERQVPSSGEKRLLEVLLEKYKPSGQNARPVYNASKPVQVLFGLGLIQMELNEKDNILSLSTWTRYAWLDEFLRWDPTEYDNVSTIRVHGKDIWTPDIMLYNTANVERESREALLVVSADGSIKWFPHSIFRSTCAVDVANYPFDIQECNLWFGSWTYPSHEVDLEMAVPGGIDLKTFQADYKKASKWEVANLTAERRLLPSEEESPNFAVLTFKLYLRRRMVFSTYMLTLPCVFLACLTLVVFWLPPERPDRTALAMNAFASFMVLLLILVEAAMPTASSVPTLGVYYCFNLVIIMVSIFLSSLVVNISRGQPGKRVPVWMNFMVVQVLARMICFHRVSTELQTLMEEYSDVSKVTDSEAPSRKKRYLICCRDKTKDEEDDVVEQLNSSNCVRDKKMNSVITAGVLEQQFKELRRCIERFETKADERVRNQRKEFIIGLEWRTVGIILDRFFFYVYIGLICISLAVFFPRPLEPENIDGI